MRQGGFTTGLAVVEAVHDFLYAPYPSVVCLSKNISDAVGFIDKFYLAYESVKDRDPNWKPLVVTNTKNAKSEGGGIITAFTSSKGAGRSVSGTQVNFDEMAHTQYASEIYTSSYPTISRTGGRICVLSTPNGKSGKFFEICENYKDMGYSYHQYEWWFVPFYNPYYKEFLTAYLAKDKKQVQYWINKARTGQWYIQTMNALGELAFMQEYECNFDASEGSVFNTMQLAGVFVKNYLVQDFEDYGEVWRIPPKDGHHHVTFIDYGRKRDPVVMITFDWSDYPARVVEYKRIRPSAFNFDDVKNSAFRTIELYNSDCYHDGTGAGDVLTAYLEGYSQPRVMGDGQLSRVKTNMIERLKLAIDTKAIIMPKIPQIYNEFKAYVYNDKKIVQDCVMAVGGAVAEFYEPNQDVPTFDSGFSYVQGSDG